MTHKGVDLLHSSYSFYLVIRKLALCPLTSIANERGNRTGLACMVMFTWWAKPASEFQEHNCENVQTGEHIEYTCLPQRNAAHSWGDAMMEPPITLLPPGVLALSGQLVSCLLSCKLVLSQLTMRGSAWGTSNHPWKWGLFSTLCGPVSCPQISSNAPHCLCQAVAQLGEQDPDGKSETFRGKESFHWAQSATDSRNFFYSLLYWWSSFIKLEHLWTRGAHDNAGSAFHEWQLWWSEKPFWYCARFCLYVTSTRWANTELACPGLCAMCICVQDSTQMPVLQTGPPQLLCWSLSSIPYPVTLCHITWFDLRPLWFMIYLCNIILAT